MIKKWLLNWFFPPITLDMYSQREQEDFYFWVHENDPCKPLLPETK